MPPTTPVRPTGAVPTLALVALLVAAAAAGLWGARHQDQPTSAESAASTPAGSERGREAADTDAATDPGLGDAAEALAADELPDEPRMLVISVDGLGSMWVTQQTTPTIADLFAGGAGTLNARTEVERTVTLPNHTGMVTGDRVAATRGGHGVTWNSTDDRLVAPGTESVFTALDDAGLSSAVFAGKDKFEMWGRAWPGAIEELVIEEDQRSLVSAAIDDLRNDDHDLVLLHLAGPDAAGHEAGWGSPAYLSAVGRADADVDRVVSAIAADRELAGDVVVVVTADHGGVPGTTAHKDTARPESFTIPFVAWGPGVTPGDLYALNPDYREPGTGMPGYGGAQPVRNGDVANLVTRLLGLEPVPGSLFGKSAALNVR